MNASLSLKQFVDKIVLFSGDSDFVPASKLARRESIDFVFDPTEAFVEESLFEHIDGLKKCNSTNPQKFKSQKSRIGEYFQIKSKRQ